MLDKYEEFESKFVKLYYEVFGESPIKWVIPILTYDEHMAVKEDVLVPQEQIFQDTLGLLRWAQIELETNMTREDS